MADVEIGFGTVFGHVDLTMLERVHGARVDVDVRIELLLQNMDTAAAQQRPSEDAVRPLPREETTPPVTKICLVTCS